MSSNHLVVSSILKHCNVVVVVWYEGTLNINSHVECHRSLFFWVINFVVCTPHGNDMLVCGFRDKNACKDQSYPTYLVSKASYHPQQRDERLTIHQIQQILSVHPHAKHRLQYNPYIRKCIQ